MNTKITQKCSVLIIGKCFTIHESQLESYFILKNINIHFREIGGISGFFNFQNHISYMNSVTMLGRSRLDFETMRRRGTLHGRGAKT